MKSKSSEISSVGFERGFNVERVIAIFLNFIMSDKPGFGRLSAHRKLENLQAWTKVLGQICTLGAFAHTLDANATSLA